MIDMCYPSSGCDNFIENWALFYILELEDYCRRTGDVTLAKLSASKVNGLLEYFAAKENEFGLLENASGWVFVEWSRANDKKFTEGVNFPSNMLYAAALESAGRLYGGDMAQKAGNLRGRIREFSFNGEFFEDNCVRENGVLVRKGHTSETCHITRSTSERQIGIVIPRCTKNFSISSVPRGKILTARGYTDRICLSADTCGSIFSGGKDVTRRC